MQKLDLHGTNHEDAGRDIIRFIEDNWDSDKVIEVITGNSPLMRNIVKEIADQYNLSYTVGVPNTPNNGCIRIQM